MFVDVHNEDNEGSTTYMLHLSIVLVLRFDERLLLLCS